MASCTECRFTRLSAAVVLALALPTLCCSARISEPAADPRREADPDRGHRAQEERAPGLPGSRPNKRHLRRLQTCEIGPRFDPAQRFAGLASRLTSFFPREGVRNAGRFTAPAAPCAAGHMAACAFQGPCLRALVEQRTACCHAPRKCTATASEAENACVPQHNGLIGLQLPAAPRAWRLD